jgi:hypothetical protein
VAVVTRACSTKLHRLARLDGVGDRRYARFTATWESSRRDTARVSPRLKSTLTETCGSVKPAMPPSILTSTLGYFPGGIAGFVAAWLLWDDLATTPQTYPCGDAWDATKECERLVRLTAQGGVRWCVA